MYRNTLSSFLLEILWGTLRTYLQGHRMFLQLRKHLTGSAGLLVSLWTFATSKKTRKHAHYTEVLKSWSGISVCAETLQTHDLPGVSSDAQSNLASTLARSLWSQFKVSFCAKPTQTSIHSSYTQHHVHSVAGPHIICRKTQAILPVCGKVYLFNANRN